MKSIKMINLALISFALLTLGSSSYAQSALVPVTLWYQFEAASADSCGIGGIRFFGYQTTQTNWSVHGQVGNYSSPPDGYLAFSWHLDDEIGELASGSFDSRTGASTGGTHGPSFDFTIPRVPVGEISFVASGSLRVLAGGGTCGESFNATTGITAGSGGRVDLLLSGGSGRIVLQSKQSGLVLQIAGASPAENEPATQGVYGGTTNQQWDLTFDSIGYHFTNSATGKRLHSDPHLGNSLVFQLTEQPGAIRFWRFVSVGDGSYYVVLNEDSLPGPGPPSFIRYGLKPVGDSSSPGAQIEATERTNQLSQQWWVLRPQ